MADSEIKFSRQGFWRHNYELAKMIMRKKCDIDWNDLADTNSLWDYVTDDEMSDEQLESAAYEAMSDRVSEDEISHMARITMEDIWHKERK